MRKAKKSTFLIGTFTFATSCLPIQENLIEVPSYTPPKIQKKIEVTGKLESCILQNIKTKTLLREGDIVLKILSEGVGFTVFEVTSIDTNGIIINSTMLENSKISRLYGIRINYDGTINPNIFIKFPWRLSSEKSNDLNSAYIICQPAK